MADEGTGTDSTQPPPPPPAPTPPPSTPPAGAPAGSPPVSGQSTPPEPTLKTRPQTPVTTNQPQQQQQPTVLAPRPEPGLKGVINEVGRWMAGTQGTRVYYDQDNNRYVGHTDPYTGKQAWARVGAAALRGAVAGLAAGRGAGNMGKAALAGYQAQQEASQAESEKQENEADKNAAAQRQARLDKAADQVRQLQVTEAQLRMDRLKQEGTDDMIKHSHDEDDRYHADGGEDLGIYKSDNIQEIQKARPDIWKDHHADNSIHSVAQYDAKGNPTGVKFWYVPPDRNAEAMPAGTQIPHYVKNQDATQIGTTSYETPSKALTRGEFDAAQQQYQKDMRDDQTRLTGVATLQEKQAAAQAEAAKAPYAGATAKAELQRIRSETAASDATAAEKRHELGMMGFGSEPGAQDVHGETYLSTFPVGLAQQIRAIANGDAQIPPPGTRNKDALAMRNMVFQYDPTFKDSRYVGKQNFRTKGDAQSLVSYATALGHLEMALNHSSQAGFAPLMGTDLTGVDATYKTDIDNYSSEAGKLIAGKALTQGEFNEARDGLLSMRGDIRQKKLTESAKLMTSKMDALMQKYKNATGQDFPISEYFDAPTQQRLQRYGMGGVAPTTGGVSLPPSAVSQLKEGLVTTFGNGQKWTLQNGRPQQIGTQ